MPQDLLICLKAENISSTDMFKDTLVANSNDNFAELLCQRFDKGRVTSENVFFILFYPIFQSSTKSNHILLETLGHMVLNFIVTNVLKLFKVYIHK